MKELRFFNPYAEIRHTENRLPHWQQDGAVYFLTFRLADSVPRQVREQWEDERNVWMPFHPKPWTRLMSKANITGGFQARSNDGSMPDMANACCDGRIARISLEKRCSILMTSGSA